MDRVVRRGKNGGLAKHPGRKKNSGWTEDGGTGNGEGIWSDEKTSCRRAVLGSDRTKGGGNKKAGEGDCRPPLLDTIVRGFFLGKETHQTSGQKEEMLQAIQGRTTTTEEGFMEKKRHFTQLEGGRNRRLGGCSGGRGGEQLGEVRHYAQKGEGCRRKGEKILLPV